MLTACPAGRYGVDCARVTLCGDGAQNDPITGRCECIPGRRGEDCGHGEFLELLIQFEVLQKPAPEYSILHTKPPAPPSMCA